MRRSLRTVVCLVSLSLALGITACNRVKASSHVAFMGDSLTEMWTLPRVNLGKYGQTTAQMLKRFPTDIANRNLRSVIILGGTNDVLLGIDPETTISNLSSMAAIARSRGIEPVLCEIPPIYARQGTLAPQVVELNRRIAVMDWTLERKVSLFQG